MDNNGNNKFLNGFIWGFIIGGALVFLLGTKKGKKLLRAISEEGLENITDILESQDEEHEDEEQSQETQTSSSNHDNHKNGEAKKYNPVIDTKSKIRRFFRRSKKI